MIQLAYGTLLSNNFRSVGREEIYIGTNNILLEGRRKINSPELSSHVDDFSYGGNEEFEKRIIGELRKRIKIGNVVKGGFRYISQY